MSSTNPNPQWPDPPIKPGPPPPGQPAPPQPTLAIEPIDTAKVNYLSSRGQPRRCYIDLQIPAEATIRNAVQAVESCGCDTRLTDAVVLLSQALDKVADWAEATGNIRPEEAS